MTRVGLLSDTHGFLPQKTWEFFSGCNEIWHAGDVGDASILDDLSSIGNVRAVYGNIDGPPVRGGFPAIQLFTIEQTKVLMTHIGGYPGRYESEILRWIKNEKPSLFISGHSHILKVMFDKKYKLLHINPGAAGKYGFHLVMTMVRFSINETNISDLEVLELQK